MQQEVARQAAELIGQPQLVGARHPGADDAVAEEALEVGKQSAQRALGVALGGVGGPSQRGVVGIAAESFGGGVARLGPAQVMIAGHDHPQWLASDGSGDLVADVLQPLVLALLSRVRQVAADQDQIRGTKLRRLLAEILQKRAPCRRPACPLTALSAVKIRQMKPAQQIHVSLSFAHCPLPQRACRAIRDLVRKSV